MFKVGSKGEKCFLGPWQTTLENVDRFMEMVNAGSRYVLKSMGVPLRIPDQQDMREIVGRTKRTFLQGGDVMVECEMVGDARHLHLGIDLLARSGKRFVIGSIVSVNSFQLLSAIERPRENERGD